MFFYMNVLLSMVLINRVNKYVLLLDNLLFSHSSEENLLFLFSWFLIHEVLGNLTESSNENVHGKQNKFQNC